MLFPFERKKPGARRSPEVVSGLRAPFLSGGNCQIAIRKFRDPGGFSVPFSSRVISPAMVSRTSSFEVSTMELSSLMVSTMRTISARASGRSKWISPLADPLTDDLCQHRLQFRDDVADIALMKKGFFRRVCRGAVLRLQELAGGVPAGLKDHGHAG